MSDVIGAHTDLYTLAAQMKNAAMRRGHANPAVSQNGTGYTLTCPVDGAQTHLVQHSGGEWRALASPAHRLNTANCNS